jgi:hypothetical protein
VSTKRTAPATRTTLPKTNKFTIFPTSVFWVIFCQNNERGLSSTGCRTEQHYNECWYSSVKTWKSSDIRERHQNLKIFWRRNKEQENSEECSLLFGSKSLVFPSLIQKHES